MDRGSAQESKGLVKLGPAAWQMVDYAKRGKFVMEVVNLTIFSFRYRSMHDDDKMSLTHTRSASRVALESTERAKGSNKHREVGFFQRENSPPSTTCIT